MRRLGRIGMALAFVLSLALATVVMAAEPAPEAAPAEQGGGAGPQIEWTEGPAKVDLGDDLAEVAMVEGYLFCGPDDTRELMAYFGNPPTNAEVGTIVPASDDNWFVVFEYFPIGYVKDDEKDKIDADAILESYRKGTEESNKQRAEMGVSAVHVSGWYEKPAYDPATNNLKWAMLLKDDDGSEVVNYNVRILGRKGYMSAVLVTDPQSLAGFAPEVERILSNFSYKSGSRYAEFVKGDKLAKIGLTALVAGGAGAVAAKLGFFQFLAKAWKAIVVAIAAGAAALWRFLRGMFSSEEKGPKKPPGTESAPK